jgi:membrane associated rhomboid family serine protease
MTRQVPLLTLTVAALTAALAALAFFEPLMLAALRRDPAALQHGACWRLFSPLLVRVDGWIPLAIVVVGTVAAGTIVERAAGRWRWLVLYVGGGVVGQAFGYMWDPDGAGSSVAVLGLFAWIWCDAWHKRGRVDLHVRLVGVAGLSALAALAGAAILEGSPVAAAVLACWLAQPASTWYSVLRPWLPE